MILASLNYIKTCCKASFLMFNANSAIHDLCHSNTILERGVSGRFSFLLYWRFCAPNHWLSCLNRSAGPAANYYQPIGYESFYIVLLNALRLIASACCETTLGIACLILAYSSSGPDNLDNLRRLAEQFQKQVPGAETGATAAAQDDDDVPELVPGETFEEAAEEKEPELEEKKES